MSLIAGVYFITLPKIISVETGVEENIPIARAEAVNMATFAFIQSRGREAAMTEWAAASGDQERYELLHPFLAFPPKDFDGYMPEGFALVLPQELNLLRKVPLLQGEQIGY